MGGAVTSRLAAKDVQHTGQPISGQGQCQPSDTGPDDAPKSSVGALRLRSRMIAGLIASRKTKGGGGMEHRTSAVARVGEDLPVEVRYPTLHAVTNAAIQGQGDGTEDGKEGRSDNNGNEEGNAGQGLFNRGTMHGAFAVKFPVADRDYLDGTGKYKYMADMLVDTAAAGEARGFEPLRGEAARSLPTRHHGPDPRGMAKVVVDKMSDNAATAAVSVMEEMMLATNFLYQGDAKWDGGGAVKQEEEGTYGGGGGFGGIGRHSPTDPHDTPPEMRATSTESGGRRRTRRRWTVHHDRERGREAGADAEGGIKGPGDGRENDKSRRRSRSRHRQRREREPEQYERKAMEERGRASERASLSWNERETRRAERRLKKRRRRKKKQASKEAAGEEGEGPQTTMPQALDMDALTPQGGRDDNVDAADAAVADLAGASGGIGVLASSGAGLAMAIARKGRKAALESQEDLSLSDFQLANVTMAGWPDINHLKPAGGTEKEWEEANPVLRCAQCDSNHRASSMAHTYRYCNTCQCQFADPTGTIPHCAWKPLWQLPTREGTGFVWVLSASVGHHLDPARAVDATACIAERIRSSGFQRLYVDDREDVASMFPEASLPNGLSWDDDEPKDIRIRYEVVINGTAAGSTGYRYFGFAKIPLHRRPLETYDRSKDHGQRKAAVSRGTAAVRLVRPLEILARDEPPLTRIMRARWGVLGPHYSLTPSAYDVTEALQYMVDENGGDYLRISRYQDVVNMFGDPSHERGNVLYISFSVRGRGRHTCSTYIDRGHLEERIDLIDVPVVAPLLVIDKATYGLPAVAMAERARNLDRRLDELREVGRKKRLKLGLSATEHRMLRTMKELRDEVAQLVGVSPAWYDVSGAVQLMVDRLGGHTLDLGSDLNLGAIFGDPLPGLPKELSLQYHVNSLNEELPPDEMASDGLSFRTFWVRKHFTEKVNVNIDPETHLATLATPLQCHATASIPQLAVMKAGWEVVRTGFSQDVVHHTQDCTRQFLDLVQRQGNTRLRIHPEDNLWDLLQVDPPRRPFNKLSITYEVRGVDSSLTVEQRPGTTCLVSPVVIGYPPQPIPTNASVDAVDTIHGSMTLTEGSAHGSHGGSVVGTGVYGHMDELGLGGDDDELRSLTSSKLTGASPIDVGVLGGLMAGRYADVAGRATRARVQLPEGGFVPPEGLGQPSAGSVVSFPEC